MPTIAEHLGIALGQIKFSDHPALPGVGALGYEVELENAKSWPVVKGWVKKPDGSLRDGIEYIFDGPQSGEKAVLSLEAFHDAMAKAKPDPTFRCSTHVHLDVRDMQFNEYERLILAYIVFEDVMFDHIDRRRRDSNFCVPFYKNDWLSAAFGRRILAPATEGQKFRGMGNWPKYSALNLQVTSSFGSVEFRGGHAMTDKVELLQLGQRMLALKAVAMNSKSTDHYAFLEELKKLGVKKVFKLGIRKDYAMDEGAFEQGMSAAMHALLTCEMERAGLERGVPDLFAAGTARPRDGGLDGLVHTVLRRNVTYDPAALLAVNMQVPPRRHTYQDAIKMAVALNRLNGVDVALSGLLANRNNEELRFIRDNLPAFERRMGFPIPAASVR